MNLAKHPSDGELRSFANAQPNPDYESGHFVHPRTPHRKAGPTEVTPDAVDVCPVQ